MNNRQSDLDVLYRENILDHYRRPRNFGRLHDADRSRREANFSCGDDVEVFVRLAGDGTIGTMSFEGRGCAISQAAASMLTEKAIGAASDEIGRWGLKEIAGILGVEIGPGRERCALLALQALQKALSGHN